MHPARAGRTIVADSAIKGEISVVLVGCSLVRCRSVADPVSRALVVTEGDCVPRRRAGGVLRLRIARRRRYHNKTTDTTVMVASADSRERGRPSTSMDQRSGSTAHSTSHAAKCVLESTLRTASVLVLLPPHRLPKGKEVLVSRHYVCVSRSLHRTTVHPLHLVLHSILAVAVAARAAASPAIAPTARPPSSPPPPPHTHTPLSRLRSPECDVHVLRLRCRDTAVCLSSHCRWCTSALGDGDAGWQRPSQAAEAGC